MNSSLRGEEPSITAVALGATLLFFLANVFFLSIAEIGSSSEAREIHIAALIAAKHEWILPLRNGVFPSKPPLFHWLTVMVSMLFGAVSPFTARLTSLLAGAGTVGVCAWLAGALACEMGSEERRQRGSVALLAAVILSFTYEFGRLAADGRVDMVHSFFVVLAYAVLLRVLVPSADLPMRFAEGLISWKRWCFFYFAAALAVLAKGPIGLVLPLVIAATAYTYLFGLQPTIKLFIKPRIGWLVFIAVAIPWYLLATVKGGEGFVGRQIIFENIERLLGGEDINRQPFWFYIPSVLRSAAPWSLLFFIFLPALLRPSVLEGQPYFSRFSHRPLVKRVLASVALGFVAGLALFSLASGKRHAYLVPLFPLMAIVVAVELHELYLWAREGAKAKVQKGMQAIVKFAPLFLFIVSLALELVWFPLNNEQTIIGETLHYLRAAVPSVQITFLVSALLGQIILIRSPSHLVRREIVAWFCFLLFMNGVIMLGLGAKNYLKGFSRMAAELSCDLGGMPLTVLKARQDEFFDPLLYYYGKETQLVMPPTAAVSPGKHYLTYSQWVAAHRAELGPITTLHEYSLTADRYQHHEERKLLLFTVPSAATQE